MTRTITILTSGTRGDVQPLIALGMGLRASGHRVRIATHIGFKPLIDTYGLQFTRVEGNPNDLLVLPEHRTALTYNGNVVHSIKATWRFLRAAKPHFERMLDTAWQACYTTDALIVTLPTTWGHQIAERLGIPCIWALAQPLSRTGAFPSVFQPWRRSFGARYNRLTHWVLEQSLWQPWRLSLNRWRRHTLGLPPIPLLGPHHAVYANDTPFVYGFSRYVVPRPADWPPAHVITGFWFLDPPAGWQPPAQLQAFLAAGPPPVYIGFGSMDQGRSALMAQAIAALEQTGQRGVLLLSRRMVPSVSLPPTIFPLDAVPHDWLFPQLAAVVHHGGAGTTAASLRAGVPTVVVPFGVDQFFWGQRVAELGVGPRPIPARSLSTERLAAAIHSAVSDAALRQRAAILGQRIGSEDGVEQAVALIQQCI